MKGGHWLLSGFLATIVLTTLLAIAKGVRWTRLDFPYLIGTVFVRARRPARVIGAGVHFVIGELVALVYVATFHAVHRSGALFGASLGAVHASFVLAAMMPLLPSIHPRVASELAGPTSTRTMEPPGFLALHYGMRTPIFILVAHVIYGAIVGAVYSPAIS